MIWGDLTIVTRCLFGVIRPTGIRAGNIDYFITGRIGPVIAAAFVTGILTAFYISNLFLLFVVFAAAFFFIRFFGILKVLQVFFGQLRIFAAAFRFVGFTVCRRLFIVAAAVFGFSG